MAKEAWRFLHHPDSLVFCVFKARYFPMVNFLEARVNSNSSYVWQSIASSRPVLQKGLQWHVGNGMRVRIWHDEWVPRESCFRILTPPLMHWDVDAMVDKFFWVESKQWNVQLLNELFSPEEVALIRGIPLSLRDTIDRRIWNYERHGEVHYL